MRKLLIWLVIFGFSLVLANSVLARGEKSEIRFDIPSQSTGTMSGGLHLKAQNRLVVVVMVLSIFFQIRSVLDIVQNRFKPK